MYYQIREDTFYIMLYTVVAMLSLIASCYLLFRQGNAFARDVTPPLRLRRWVAAFFACMTLSHVWYMPILFLTSSDDVKLNYLIGALLDYLIVFPLGIVVLFVMLQDRRRPLWPVAMMTAPPVVIMAWCVVTCSDTLLQILYAYLLLLGVCLIIYMVRAVRQYGHWLRDNYADLEHKEVWQSFVVLAIILLVFGIYAIGARGPASLYIFEINDIMLICYLLWRVETLSDLSLPINDAAEEMVNTKHEEDNALSLPLRNNIGTLLQQYCIDTQLYLQHDVTLLQLAKAIGTNRSYLSKHFALQGITYNAYINGLRIQHFMNLYREATATHQTVTARQLAAKSGFRSYSTFNAAFKQAMGMTATEWMRVSES